MKLSISVRNLSKKYRLGVIGYGTLYRDLQSWFAKLKGREDPNSLIGFSGNNSVINAVSNLNLDVEKGEILGVIGANGAGKSTLLKLLSRITSPTEGEIGINGRLFSLLEVGTGFHPELTGRENIFLNAAIYGLNRAEIENKIEEIINFSGVKKFIDTPVKRYSSGMHVRLGFAVAANLDPDILVVDEVLAVGDAYFQKKALQRMKELKEEEKKRTIIFVSHNLQSIERLCTRAILLSKGKIIYDGKPSDTIQEYLSFQKADVKSFVNFDEIENRKDLKQDKKLLKSISLFDNRDKPQTVFNIGDTIKIKICLSQELIGKMPGITMEIKNNLDQTAAVLSTRAMVTKDYKIETDEIICIFNNNRLKPDQYRIDIGLKFIEDNIKTDKVLNAINFRIKITNELKNAGFSKESTYLPEGEWKFTK
tara:strand:+ start:37 stop:1305 length:1269 start_codon:yes stop_codon:yes gene_type:complete